MEHDEYKKYHIQAITFLILIHQGCSNQLSINEYDSHSEQKNIRTRSFMDCLGDKMCLPIVDIQHLDEYSSTPGTLISWSHSSVNNCENFTLEVTCKAIDYKISQHIRSSGSIFLSHNSDEYSVDYQIRCGSSSKCRLCTKRETFVKKKNNNGQKENYGNCQKKYMSYSVEPGSNGSGFKLICTSPYEVKNNLNDYLAVDTYIIYTNNYGETPRILQEGSITPDVSVIYHPCEPLKYYEIRFYSSKCDHNYEHYIYGDYSWQQCDRGQGLSILYLQEKLHSGG